jgi:hypothetical protein
MTESKQLRDLRSVFSRIATDPNAWQLLRALPNPDPILRKAGKRAEVFAEISRDAHVIGELRSMRAGLLAYPTELVPGGTDAASMASYEVAKRLFSAEPGINSRWADIDWHLYSAILNGYACLHLGKFIQVEGFWVPSSIEAWENRRFAFDPDHRLLLKTKANLGAYLSTFSSCVPTYLYAPLLSGQYNIPAIYVEVEGIYTNTAPVDAYRGAGRPEATFVIERMVEVAAREMGQDPAAFRRKNFIKSFPHQTPVIMAYDTGNYGASMDLALEMADYKNFGKRKRDSAKKGMLRGIGFSAYIEACGIAPSAAVGSLGAGVGLWESAEVRVNPVGTVEVLTGSHSHGQGHETTFAQLVSDRLGIGIDQVAIVHGDTDKVQFGMGTYGSRSGAVGMSAISKALDKVQMPKALSMKYKSMRLNTVLYYVVYFQK